MEVRKLEIDFNKGLMKINGKDYTEIPVIVTLPGPDGWPLRKLFNAEHATCDPERFDELEVLFAGFNSYSMP